MLAARSRRSKVVRRSFSESGSQSSSYIARSLGL